MVSQQTYIKQLTQQLYSVPGILANDLEELLSNLREDLIARNVVLEYSKQEVKEFILDKFVDESNKPSSYGWNSKNVLVLLDLVERYS